MNLIRPIHSEEFYRKRSSFYYGMSWVALGLALPLLAFIADKGLTLLDIAVVMSLPALLVVFGRFQGKSYADSAENADKNAEESRMRVILRTNKV